MTFDPYRAARPRQRQPVRHPTVATASGRRLPCYPASVLAFIVDSWDRFMLLRSPGQTGWEVVGAGLEPGETVQDAVLRSVKEWAGPQFLASYLGVLDTFTYLFDANLPPQINICCLLRYRGGDVRPDSGVSEADYRWWALTELDDINLTVPRGRWDLLTRAVDLSRYLRDAREPEDDVGGSLGAEPW